MKLKITIALFAIILLSGCAGKKEVSDLKGRVDELEAMLNDTDKDGVPDYLDSEPETPVGVAVDIKGRANDLNGNSIPDELEIYLDNKDKSYGNVSSTAAEYITTLKPTAKVGIKTFFKDNESLYESNRKLIDKITKKMNYQFLEYKYFSLGNGDFGIITNKQCIDLNGNPRIDKCLPTKSCAFYDITCAEEGHSQFFIFLITKLNYEGGKEFSEKEFDQIFRDENLQYQYDGLSELRQLIDNKKNLSGSYYLEIRLFEIKRQQGARPVIVDTATYKFADKMKTIFKN